MKDQGDPQQTVGHGAYNKIFINYTSMRRQCDRATCVICPLEWANKFSAGKQHIGTGK